MDPLNIQPDDLDSAHGDSDLESATSSLRSSIFNHVYENGRRYNAYRSGTYWGPNDERAQENLDLQHHNFTMAFGGRLYLAPIEDAPQRVLDLGTGTGIWAIDFADMHPTASVIGTDLSPVQPNLIPPNLEFLIDDFTEEWSFKKESFDFIHARELYGCVTDYNALYTQIKEHLKPGGWFEQVEVSVCPVSNDDSIKGTALEEWGPLALQAGEKFGKPFSALDHMKERLESLGYINVRRETFVWPIGPWPKDPNLKLLGAYNRLAWDEGLEGWAMFLFTNYMKAGRPSPLPIHSTNQVIGLHRSSIWSREQVQVLLATIRKDLRNPALHGYQEVIVCYGQKPPLPPQSKAEIDTVATNELTRADSAIG